jgi:DNA modification methylase
VTTTQRYLIGDVRDVLARLPPRSVDLVLTSPPFLHLRAYLPDDHPDKGKEMGREANPAAFIDALLDVTEACARVLAPHGSLVFELGDTSSGSGGAGGDHRAGKLRGTVPLFGGSAAASRRARGENRVDKRIPGREHDAGESLAQAGARMGGSGWPATKSLCLIPEAFRLSLAYGRNVLRPERATDPWIIRNVVSWVRTNPPPGRLGDKYRRATTTLVVATKSPGRWYDDHEVRTPYVEGRVRVEVGRRDDTIRARNKKVSVPAPGATAPPLDWWQIASRSYRSTTDHTHYASYPEELCRIPILTMCPPRVCTWCGTPPRRTLTPTAEYSEKLGGSICPKNEGLADRQLRGKRGAHSKGIVAERVHDGWAECDCPDLTDRWRRGVVLDPFAGTGTTLVVADRYDRDGIGIDLDQRNAAIAHERIPHLTTEPTEHVA